MNRELPASPPDEVRSELRRFLKKDSSRLGEVYRLTDQGLLADEIAQELGVRTSGFVWNYNRYARALLDGSVPTSSTLAAQTASQVRRLLKTPEFSGATVTYLQRLLRDLNEIAGRPPGARAQDSHARAPRRSEQPSPPRLADEQGKPRRRNGWRRLVAEEIARNYAEGQTFTFRDLYRRSERRLRAAYPRNTTLEHTLMNILQRLRDDGLLEFLERGEYRYIGVGGRGENESESIRGLVEALVERIATETTVDADDYLEAATSADPGVAVQQLVASGRTSPTFQRLRRIKRRDLTLETLVSRHPHLFDDAVLDEARGRLQFYFDAWTSER